MRLSFLLLMALVLVGYSVEAKAAEKHEMLKQVEAQGYKVDFMGNAYGMDGWIIRDDKDQAQYAYTTKEGALVMGFLITPTGDVHTFEQVEAMRDVLKTNSRK